MRRALAMLFSAAPFVAGGVAARSARHDVRLLVMAVVATAVAWAVVRVPQLRGAGAAAGIAAVSVVLGGCATVGAVLARSAGA